MAALHFCDNFLSQAVSAASSSFHRTGVFPMTPFQLAFTRSAVALWGKMIEAQLVAVIGMTDCMLRHGPFAPLVMPCGARRSSGPVMPTVANSPETPVADRPLRRARPAEPKLAQS
jgi:hypothetical protein